MKASGGTSRPSSVVQRQSSSPPTTVPRRRSMTGWMKASSVPTPTARRSSRSRSKRSSTCWRRSSSKTRIWPGPLALAWYMATSASRRSSSRTSSGSRKATPMDADTGMRLSPTGNGSARRAGCARRAGRWCRSRRPPRPAPRTRHRRCGPRDRRHVWPAGSGRPPPQHVVAHLVPVRVVDRLEPVEVDEQRPMPLPDRLARAAARSSSPSRIDRLASPVRWSWVASWARRSVASARCCVRCSPSAIRARSDRFSRASHTRAPPTPTSAASRKRAAAVTPSVCQAPPTGSGTEVRRGDQITNGKRACVDVWPSSSCTPLSALDGPSSSVVFSAPEKLTVMVRPSADRETPVSDGLMSSVE